MNRETDFTHLCQHKNYLLFCVACLLALLAACGPQSPSPGLDAVAQKGKVISIVESTTGTPRAVLSVIDADKGKLLRSLPSADLSSRQAIPSSPASRISPDGKFLLYKQAGEWQLLNIESGQVQELVYSDEDLEFLPDGHILIAQSFQQAADNPQPEIWFKLWTAMTIQPNERTPVTERGSFMFQNQRTSQADKFQILIFSIYFGAPYVPLEWICPPPASMQQYVAVIIDTDGVVKKLVANAQDMQVITMTTLSHKTMDLLNERQRSLKTVLMGLASMAATQKAALPTETPLPTPASTQVETEEPDYFTAVARSGILGQVSPDGQHLMLLSVTSMTDSKHAYFSLELVDLERDISQTLSDNTAWIPRFLFAPDGSQILFESNLAFGTQPSGERTWYLASPDGTNIHPLNLGEVQYICWD